MATTASLLKAGPVFMSWKHHQQFCSRQISSNNNFLSLEKKSDHLNPRNPTELRLVRVSSSIVSSNLRSKLSRNYSKGSSNFHEDGIFGDLKKLVCSRNINLFGDDVGSMSVIVEKLSRKFALQLAGLLLMMMAMALASRSKDSAFAASNGRMGGSISNSYSSSGSCSSSNSSSYSGSSSCCYHHHLSPEDQAISFIGAICMIIFIIVIYLRKQREIEQVFSCFRFGTNCMRFSHILGYVLIILFYFLFLFTQVGILDKKRVLQRKLNTIAESADTSTSRGLSQLLDEVSYALLQHHDSCRFVYFLERCNHSMEDSLIPFYRRLKITERKRYDRETFTNVDGVKLERPSAIEVNSVDNEYSVVTVLVLASGRYDIPSLTVDSTLQTLYSIPRKKIKAVEVLWSPQSEGDTISEQELRRDFPHMSSCYDKEKKIPQKWWKWLLV